MFFLVGLVSTHTRAGGAHFVLFLSLSFHKNCFIRSCVCRTILIRNALEDSELGTSNGVSNLLIRLFGADLVTFEVAG